MIGTIGRLFGLFFENSKIRLAQAMAYRLNFLLDSVISFVQGLIAPLLQYLIFSQTKGIPGWSLPEIVLFQGVLLFYLGLRGTVFGGVYPSLQGMVHRGEFDRLLLKPYPAIGSVLASGFTPQSAGGILAGPVVIILAAASMRLEIPIVAIGLALALLVSGLFFYMSFAILYSSAVIVLVHLGRLYDIFWTLERFGQYPLEIFPRGVRLLFMTVVPMAIWTNFPAQVLLGRGNINILWSLLGSVAFFSLSLLVWRASLRRYTSAGG